MYCFIRILILINSFLYNLNISINILKNNSLLFTLKQQKKEQFSLIYFF